MYTYQQRLEYAQRLHRLQKAVVIKDNIHLTYKYKNRNKAHANIDSVQDRINKAIIDDAVNGNGESIKNLDKQGEKLIHDTLTNERKRLHKDKNHKAVNQATKSNSQYYTNIFNYRRKKIGESLSDKIENELKDDVLKDLSDTAKIKHLQEKFDGHGTKRLKNIVTDAIHTNESNIGWIKAVEDGFNYKVWKNGRVAKGRTRAWHKEKIISAVPIDETFDIYGSYPAHMMYPGDLNGGAENVANCKCWLLYTNRVPSNLRRKTVFKVSPTFQDIWNNARKPASKLKTRINSLHNIKNTLSIKNKFDGLNIKNNLRKSKQKTPVRLYPKKPKYNPLKNKFKSKGIKETVKRLNKNILKLRYGLDSEIIKHDNVIIIKQNGADYVKEVVVKEAYDNLPKDMKKKVKIIVISNKNNRQNKDAIGAVKKNSPYKINLYPTTTTQPPSEYRKTVYHEAAHIFERRHRWNRYSISNMDWENIIYNDKQYIIKNNLHSPFGIFVSDYARDRYYAFKNTLPERKYSEDFAESVMEYLDENPEFRLLFPNRCEFLKELLGV